MNILLIGSAGLLGSAVLNSLKDVPSIKVSAPTRNELSLGNRNSLLDYVSSNDFDVVVNCAARVGGLYSQINYPAKYLSENITILDSLYSDLAILPNSKPKVLNFVSTCIFPAGIVFPIEPSKLHDGPPHDTNSSYSYAKRLTDVYANAYYREHGIVSSTFIFGNLFGPNDHFSSPQDAHVIPSLISKAFLCIKDESFKLKILGNGRPVREFLYSYDAANLIKNYILSPNFLLQESPKLLLFSNHDSISIYDLAKTICSIVSPHRDILLEVESSSDVGQLEKPSSTSTELLHILPKLTPLYDSIKETVDWYSLNFKP